VTPRDNLVTPRDNLVTRRRPVPPLSSNHTSFVDEDSRVIDSTFSFKLPPPPHISRPSSTQRNPDERHGGRGAKRVLKVDPPAGGGSDALSAILRGNGCAPVFQRDPNLLRSSLSEGSQLGVQRDPNLVSSVSEGSQLGVPEGSQLGVSEVSQLGVAEGSQLQCFKGIPTLRSSVSEGSHHWVRSSASEGCQLGVGPHEAPMTRG